MAKTAINDKLAIETAWKTGHFWDPRYPDCFNVEQSHLPKLQLGDKVAKYAIASLQQSDANLDFLSGLHHQRAPLFDGLIGPATMELITSWNIQGHELSRCPIPDFAPPPNASFHYDDPELQQIVERMQRRKLNELEAVGSGSFPEPCQKGGVKVYIDTSNMPAALVPRWGEIKRLVFAAYNKIGVKLVETTNAAEAHIRVSWRVLAGSTIGLAQFNSESCSPSSWVFCYLDPGYTGYVYSLFKHELGHNNNLDHTRGGIMNPSILPDPATLGVWSPSDPSYATLRRYYGGDPIEPETPDPPGPPPGGSPDRVIDRFTLEAGTYELVKKGTPGGPGGPVPL